MIGNPRSLSIVGAAYRPVDTAHRAGAGNASRCRLAAPIVGAILALPLLLVAAGRAAGAGEKLPQRYKEWLEKDVGYIISKEEKDAFLRLTRDEDRDNFIQQFWTIRSPNPSSPVNEFKEEHYRRIQHANAYFKSEWVAEGWQSDRGKIYIILGPPGSRQFFTSGGQIYPIELWLYSNNEPSLPPFFYVMFYQRQGMGDFRLYSPYIDGPDKLVRASGAENMRKNGYSFLRDFNPELARASLTLIPSEPADIRGPVSLTSDAMLMKILSLANDRFHKERIGLQRRLREEVKVRITPDLATLKVAALPLHNQFGEEFIHYSLQMHEPQNYALGNFKDKYYLDLEVQVRVLDAQKKLIYQTTRQGMNYYAGKDLAEVRARPLYYEDRVPVLAGKYQLEFVLFNRVSQTYYRANTDVGVEPVGVSALTLGRPVLVQRCDAAASDDEPFAVGGGAHCTLLARNEIPPSPNAALSLLFSVHLEPAAFTASALPLRVQYTIGRLDHTVKNQVTDDTLDRKRFDRFGTLLVGKSVPVRELQPGPYLLSVQVSDPVTGHTAGTTLPFKIAGSVLPPPNLLNPAGLHQDESSGDNDYWRGLCALAQNSTEQAIASFRRALEHNPEHQRARAQLAKLIPLK